MISVGRDPISNPPPSDERQNFSSPTNPVSGTTSLAHPIALLATNFRSCHQFGSWTPPPFVVKFLYLMNKILVSFHLLLGTHSFAENLFRHCANVRSQSKWLLPPPVYFCTGEFVDLPTIQSLACQPPPIGPPIFMHSLAGPDTSRTVHPLLQNAFPQPG